MPKLPSKTPAKLKKTASEKRHKHIEHPRSYRLDDEILQTLKDTQQRVNRISPKKITESRLVKALIWLSKEIEDEKIIKASKEVW